MTDHLAFVHTLGYFTKGPELSWKQNTVSCNFTGQITAWADVNSVSCSNAYHPRAHSPAGLQLMTAAMEQVGRPLNFLYKPGSKLLSENQTSPKGQRLSDIF